MSNFSWNSDLAATERCKASKGVHDEKTKKYAKKSVSKPFSTVDSTIPLWFQSPEMSPTQSTESSFQCRSFTLPLSSLGHGPPLHFYSPCFLKFFLKFSTSSLRKTNRGNSAVVGTRVRFDKDKVVKVTSCREGLPRQRSAPVREVSEQQRGCGRFALTLQVNDCRGWAERRINLRKKKNKNEGKKRQ